MDPTPTVFVVDDNSKFRRCVSSFLSAANLSVETFNSAKAFLASYNPTRPGCLILDIRMPDISGLDLQEKLISLGATLPIIFVSGEAVVKDAVRAMKLGSFEFLEKPFPPDVLLRRVRSALEHDHNARAQRSQRAYLGTLFQKLTEREKQILCLVISGKQSKVIADQIGLSTSTVDNHRANIMRKLQAKTSSDLVRIALLVDFNLALREFSM